MQTRVKFDVNEKIYTGYLSRPLQRVLHENLKRFNVIVCHRRFGKSIFSVNHMIDRALSCPNPMGRFAYIAPTFGQAKRILWDVLKTYASKIPGTEMNEADLRVDFPNKARIMLLSAETPDSLKGIYLDGVVLDEYASMNPAVWSEVIRPTLSDRGGWAIFIGTPKGQNNFYDLYEYAKNKNDPSWFAALYKASETRVIDQDELDSNRRTMSDDEYEQEFECSFVAGLSGAYFAKDLASAQKEGRIGQFPRDRSLPVDTYWDLGISDALSIWFSQSVRGSHSFFKYAEWSGLGLPEITQELKKLDFGIDRIILPHDAAARDLSSGRTRVQTLRSLGFRNIQVIPRPGTKQESIEAARFMFPKCKFDAVGCAEGLKMLGQYQKKWNSKNEVYENAPLHNKASHAADAFQQFALGSRDDSRDSGTSHFKKNRQGHLVADMEYSPYG